MKNDISYDLIQDLTVPFAMFFIIGVVWLIVTFMFFVKIWIACSDISAIRENLERQQQSLTSKEDEVADTKS